MNDLRQYFVIMPTVVPDEPNACRIELKVGNQMFRFGPEYCEDREHAEWFVNMGVFALRSMFLKLKAEASAEAPLIQRFKNKVTSRDGAFFDQLIEDPDGDWVAWEDVKQLLQK